MKKLTAILLGLLLATASIAGTFNQFGPANGILKGNASTPITTAATWSDVSVLLSGTCNSSVFVRGDGTCVAVSGPTGAALTKTDDTNVTLTLGGSPSTALLNASSLTLGWTGTLAASRGGTGVSSLGNLTKTDDTNVTLTLSGTPTGALINSAGLALGWTGTLAASRGGLGMSTVTDDTVAVANGTTWQSKALSSCSSGTSALTYDTATNAFGCNTISGATGANPTGTIGLTAVNGAASTFTRSDGAPALSQAIAPTWTAPHLYTSSGIGSSTAIRIQSASPWLGWRETDQTAGAQDWLMGNSGAHFLLYSSTDGSALDKAILDVARNASSSVVTSLSFGNATDNPSFSFLGTGGISSAGAATWSGTHTFTNATSAFNVAATVPQFYFDETGATTNEKWWRTVTASGNYRLQTEDDAHTINRDALNFDRSGTAITSLSFGNATDNPSYAFLGTGTSTFSGAVAVSSGATSNNLTLDSSAANGPYMTFKRAGGAIGDIGDGKQCGSSFSADSLCLTARTGNPLEMSAGGRTSPDLAIATNGGTVAGGATGGTQGAGTINATGLYVNGVSVSGGAQTTGTFTGTLTGVSGSVTCTMKYRKTGSWVALFVNAGGSCTGTSNANTLTMTGLPAAIRTTSNAAVPCYLTDNGLDVPGLCNVQTSGTMTMYMGNPYSTTAFTTSGTKGLGGVAIVNYDLRD